MRALPFLLMALSCDGSGGSTQELGTLYMRCEFEPECDEEQNCHRIEGRWSPSGLMGRFCSIECSSSADCPASPEGGSGVCFDLNELFNQCYVGCTSDGQCPEGFSCSMIPRLGASLCVP